MRNGRKYMLLILDGYFSSDLTPDPRIYPSWPELPVVQVKLSQACAFEQFFQLNAFYNDNIIDLSDVTNTAKKAT